MRGDVVERLVENQFKEIALRAQELELESQKDTNTLEYSKLALSAQERDREAERTASRNRQKDRLGFILAITVIVALLIGGALYLDKDQVALELVKAAILMLAGGAGGYGLARAQETQNPQDP